VVNISSLRGYQVESTSEGGQGERERHTTHTQTKKKKVWRVDTNREAEFI
jgi:hypothetical protein